MKTMHLEVEKLAPLKGAALLTTLTTMSPDPSIDIDSSEDPEETTVRLQGDVRL